jgi:hypothetical protein
MFQENFRDDLSLNAIAVERMLQTNKILAVNIIAALTVRQAVSGNSQQRSTVRRNLGPSSR